MLKGVSAEAREFLNDAIHALLSHHTEKCCDVGLSAQESDRHKEARAMARGLVDFFGKAEKRAADELKSLRQR